MTSKFCKAKITTLKLVSAWQAERGSRQTRTRYIIVASS